MNLPINGEEDTPSFVHTHTHIKTGGKYMYIGSGRIEADLSYAVIYQGEDGNIWVRPSTEFFDGRFETIQEPYKHYIPAPDLQQAASNWNVECFGQSTADNIEERNWRFMEEALELVQAMGASREDCEKMVDYVYSREVGDPAQEVGGTMITLALLCQASGLSMFSEGLKELIRIMQPEVIEKIRRKHMNKLHKAPLPDDYKYPKGVDDEI